MSVRLPTAAALAAVAVALAACGGDDGGGPQPPPGPDPATLVPADAPLFLEAVVRPEGEQRETLEAALSKLLATEDPGGFIVSQLDEELAEDDLSWARDIDPWLGSRAGIFFETFEDEPEGAFVAATTDEAAAQEALERIAAADRVRERERSYNGFEYLVDTDGDAAGLVEGFLVGGSEQGFRHVVDTLDGESLAGSPEFSERREAAPEGWTAFGYADPATALERIEAAELATAAEISAFREQVGAALDEPASATLSATADTIALDLTAADVVIPPSESDLIESLPGDSWFAFAAADTGASIEQATAQVPAAGLAELRDALGLDPFSELEEWGGDAAGFVRGSSLFGLGGAIVIESRDEAASAQALETLRDRLESETSIVVGDLAEEEEGDGFTVAPVGVPIEFRIVQREGRIAAGLGQESIDAVFNPGDTLADSEGFSSAGEALGDDMTPQLYLDIDAMLSLIETFPEATSDPDYQQAQPYLAHLDFLAVGLRSEEGRGVERITLGLRDAEDEAAVPDGSQAGVPWSAG